MYYATGDRHGAALIREVESHADHMRQVLPDRIPYLAADRAHPEET